MLKAFVDIWCVEPISRKRQCTWSATEEAGERTRADAGCWSGQRAVGAAIRAKEAHRLLPWITRTGGRAVGAHWTLVRRDAIHTEGVNGFPAAGGFGPLVAQRGMMN